MSQLDYTYAVARVRAKEVSLLNAAAYDQLLACQDHAQVRRALSERGWGESAEQSDEELLSSELSKTRAFIGELIKESDLLDLFSYAPDFHNLKAVIKQVCTQREFPDVYLPGGLTDVSAMLSAVKLQHFADLPAHLRAPAQEAFSLLLETRDGQLCDLVLDKACLAAIYEKGSRDKNEVLRKYAEITVASANIKIAVRACKTKKPYPLILRSLAPCASLDTVNLAKAASESPDAICEYLAATDYAAGAEILRRSPAAFERWCDGLIIEAMKPQKHNPFSVGPLVAYLLARENEIKSVRLILSAKLNGFSDEAVRERLREAYV